MRDALRKDVAVFNLGCRVGPPGRRPCDWGEARLP
jgi:hypothetical protein